MENKCLYLIFLLITNFFEDVRFCLYVNTSLSSPLIKEPNNHIPFSCQVIEISTQMTGYAGEEKAGALDLICRQEDGLGAYSVFFSSIVCAPKELGKESSQILLLGVVYFSNFILPAKSVCAQG